MRLTPTEDALYSALKLRRGQCVSFADMCGWLGYPPIGKTDATLFRAHISNLRRKLPREEAERLRALRGVGYYYARDGGTPLTVPFSPLPAYPSTIEAGLATLTANDEQRGRAS